MTRIRLTLIASVLSAATLAAIAAQAIARQAGRRPGMCRTTIVKLNGKRVRKVRCVHPPTSKANPEVFLTTSRLSHRLDHVADLRFSSTPPPLRLIPVDDRVRFQRIAGIGAAMTDASAWLIENELPPAVRTSVLQALFGRAGIRLSMLRVPIGASDFTVGGRPYSYDEMPAGQTDPTLAHFSVAHDQAYVLPILRTASILNPQLQLLATPWTAPSWMKANGALDDLGGLGALLPQDYGAYAQYLVRFIQSYASQGIRIAALTPENEPSDGSRGISFPGMTLTLPAAADLITQSLSPALRAAGLPIKIYGADNSWNQLLWGVGLLAGPAARSLTGLAWHCYFGSPTIMSWFHQHYPGAEEIVDECSPEIRPLFTAEFLIASLRNWASSVALWNVALDPAGGPVQLPNSGCARCTGMITVNEQTHTVRLDKKFFQVGQVSKFVQPGAVRIASPSFVSYSLTARDFAIASHGLDDVAFLNPDGSKVLVAYNNTPVPSSFAVRTRGRYFRYRLPGWAMATFVWDQPS